MVYIRSSESELSSSPCTEMSERYTRLRTEDRQFTDISLEEQHSDDESNNDNPQNGICLIINNTEFSCRSLPDIQDRENDEEKLQLAFTTLNFQVMIQRNLTKNDMLEVTEEVSKKQHIGAFVLIVMSHGKVDDLVYGTDGETVKVNTLLNYFIPSKCPSLADVPKIFLMDIFRSDDRNERRNDSFTIAPDFAVIFMSSPDTAQCIENVILEAKETDGFDRIAQKLKDQQPCLAIHNKVNNEYCIKRNTKIAKMQINCRKFKKAIGDWLTIRQLVMEMINEIIENLIKHRRNVNIAQIAGSTAAVGSGIMGFALIPVTFGVSLGLGIGGVAISAAGGATAAAGAGITDVFIQKNGVNDAKQHYEKDQKKLEEAMKYAEKAQGLIDEILQKCEGINEKLLKSFIQAGIFIGYHGTNVGLKVAEIAVGGFFEVGALALRIGGAAVRGVAIAGIAVNALLIPLDIIEIVRAAINMKKGNENDAVKNLQKYLRDLEFQERKIRERFELNDA